MRAIAETTGQGLGSIVSDHEANAHFGWSARFVAIDNPTSGTSARHALGWHPQKAGLLTDMRNGGYFA